MGHEDDRRLEIRFEPLEIHLRISQDPSAPSVLAEILRLVTLNQTTLKEIKMTDQEVKALLDKIDATTNATAANIATIASVDQQISDELDKLIADAAGAGISDATAAQLQAIADRAQQTSDASTAQVAVLQAIAAKGAPVVPPPPPPPTV